MLLEELLQGHAALASAERGQRAGREQGNALQPFPPLGRLRLLLRACVVSHGRHLRSFGLTGGGSGWSGLNLGEWGLWQCTHSRYCFIPDQDPVLFPCSPAFQSRRVGPWHWPQSLYDSLKSINLPLAKCSLS